MKEDSRGIIYLIPTFLNENNLEVIPGYIIHFIKQCNAFFVENERSARRYIKSLWKEMVIDDFEWVTIHKTEEEVKKQFIHYLHQGKSVGILSEAGCPGIADPGQLLIAIAHQEGAKVKPLVGPSSLLLALMASGLNGQRFSFAGYLPINSPDRKRAIRELESESFKKNCTQLFIETPYRNNQLLTTLLETCNPETQLCIAADITSLEEFIHTKKIIDWRKNIPDLDKRPAIFCLLSH